MAVHDQSLAMRRRSGGLAGDDALRLPPEPRDSERNRVARPQEDRRLLTEAHARRRARGDDVPRLEDHELRDVGDEGFCAENHGRGRAALHALAVDVQPHVELLRVLDLVGRDQPRPQWAEGRAALALHPLARALDLERTLGDVVAYAVAGDVLERLGLAHIA